LKFARRKELLKKLEEKQAEIKDRREKLRDLTNLEFSRIVHAFNAEEITPVELLKAYQIQALKLEAHGCLAEPISEAYGRALNQGWLDEADARGKIWGIPVSLKESLAIKDHDITLGLVNRIGSIATTDCLLVEMLRKAGAVPFMTSSMAPAGLSIDSSNLIYGKQTNPLNTSRISGGSSGGEAILIAKRGSMLGFGTDSAGSLRIPAAFCGVSALKPTFERLSTIGVVSAFQASSVNPKTCVGPIAREVGLLVHAMEALCAPPMFAMDPTVIPIPFNRGAYEGTLKKRLRVGYFTAFPGKFVPEPVPAVVRAVDLAVQTLRANGHHVEAFTPPDPITVLELGFRAMNADGGAEVCNVFKDEPLTKSMRLFVYICQLPRILKQALAYIVGFLYGPALGAICRGLYGPFDVMICPVTSFPALPTDAVSTYIDACLAYTLLFSLVNLPVGVVRTHSVSVDDLGSALRNIERFEAEGDRMNAHVARLQKGSRGLPVAVQVAGLPFTEETVLRVMRELEIANEGA
uniref:Amidase domain-containing protein n=1 Tax=Schistocephalus solidus TaxID=70667 RepID=A0A183TEN1_SCHSO